MGSGSMSYNVEFFEEELTQVQVGVGVRLRLGLGLETHS